MSGSDPPTQTAVMAVVRHAISRRYLTSEQLQAALQHQEALRRSGRSAELLEILREALPPESLFELGQVYHSALAESGSSPAVDSRPPASARIDGWDSEDATLLEDGSHGSNVGSGSKLAQSLLGDPRAAPRPEPRPGGAPGLPSQLGSYRIEGEIARGAMGIVYRAHSLKLDRPVALKVMRDAEMAEDVEFERFLREARAAARLRHPNIVAIHTVDIDQGRHFIAMDLIDGRSLRDAIKQDGPLPLRKAARIAEQIGQALYYAHTQSILHRDIKPANILISQDGEPYLTDFGLAKDVDSDSTQGLTQTGQTVGTPSYMSPEQASGDLDRVDRRSDVYSLGATLYEMLTGRPPFKGPTVIATLSMVHSQEPKPPGKLRRSIDRNLETIVLKCLEKQPERRYASARDLAADLKRWRDDEPIAARAPGAVDRAGRWVRRNRALAGVAAAGVVAVALSAAGTWALAGRQGDPGRGAADEAQLRELEAMLGRLERGEERNPDDAFYALVRAPSPETVALLVARLDAISADLRAAARVAYLEAEQPNESERRAGETPIAGLREALDAWAERPLVEPAPREQREAIEQAGRRLEQRAYRRLDRGTVSNDAQPAVARLIAHHQERELGARLPAARVICRALGRMGIREEAVPALGRYLHAEHDAGRAGPAGVALCQLGGADGQEIVAAAIERFGRNGSFHQQVRRALRHMEGSVALTEETARGYLRRGRLRYDRRDYPGAIQDFGRAIELDPRFAEAYSWRAYARWSNKETRAALEDADKAIGLDPTLHQAFIVRALVKDTRRERESALGDLDRAIEIQPGESWPWRVRAMTRARVGDSTGAMEDIARALAIAPKNPRNWATRGQIEFELKDWEGARRDLDRAIELDPEDGVALANRAAVRMLSGDPEGALEDYNRAIEAAGSQRVAAGAWANRGAVHTKMGDIEAAMSDFARAIKLDPTLPDAYAHRGAAHLSVGEVEEAKADLDRALRIKPDMAEAFQNRGAVRYRMGDDEGALSDLTRAIELDPTLAEARSNRGAVLNDMGRHEEGMREIEQAIQLDPRNAPLWRMAGRALLEQGKTREALEKLDQAIELAPDQAKTWRNRAEANLRLGRTELALRDHSRAIEIDPRDAEGWEARAELYGQIGDMAKAAQDFTQATRLNPDSIGAWLGRAAARASLGDARGALADLEQVEPKIKDAERLLRCAVVRNHLQDLTGALSCIVRALQVSPEDASLWGMCGGLRQRLGDTQGAIEAYERCVQLAPNHPGAQEVRDTIERLRRDLAR